MEMYHEAARSIPFRGSYDVIVAGGGPAGVAAALGAARSGASTLIVEETNCFGGMITSGLMSHWTGGTDSPVMHEIQARCRRSPWECEVLDEENTLVINHEQAKLAIFDLLEEAGVKMRLHTRCCDVICAGEAVTGIVTESKSGREAWRCRVLIDCSGDGDLAVRAGAEFRVGREGDGKMQPVTLMFKIGGVDFDRAVFPGSFETLVDTPKGELQALARKLLPPPAGHVLLYRSTMRGEVTVNMTNLTDVDGSNADDLTRAEIVCHRQIPAIVAFLREYVPGYESCFWLKTAEVVGVRETRHFLTEYELTADDILEARRFPDWIATKNIFNFDIHNVEGAGLDANGAQKHFHSAGDYSIPYGCCVPQKVENLLLAGRSIGGSHKAHSNFRVMPICANLGLGAGVAAAVAVRNGTSVREVDLEAVHARLNAMGVTQD